MMLSLPLFFALLILEITFVANSVTSWNSPLAFTHIGSFRTLKVNAVDETNYYISLNSVQWSNAQQSCRNAFGTNSSTVSVQTEEEWSFLKNNITPHEMVTTYWTSGMYDKNSNVWRWGDSSTLTSWAPWENNYPTSNPSSILRVAINHKNQYTASWRTISNSQLHRFICEVRQST